MLPVAANELHQAQTSNIVWALFFMFLFCYYQLIFFYFIFRCNDVTAPRWHTYGHNDNQQHSTCPQPCKLDHGCSKPMRARADRSHRTQTMGGNSNNRPTTSIGQGMMVRQTTQGGQGTSTMFLGPEVSFFFIFLLMKPQEDDNSEQ